MSPPRNDDSVEFSAEAAPVRRGTGPAVAPSFKSIRTVLIAIAVFASAGIAFALWLRGIPAGRPDPRAWFNVFYVLFARNEPLGLACVALFSAASLVLLRKRNHNRGSSAAEVPDHRAPWLIGGLAVFAFVVTALGTHFVCHNYSLTADEYMSDFQAKIFLHGKVLAEVPLQWHDAIGVLRPTFVDYFPNLHAWKSTYFPAYAAMRAVFLSVDLQSLLNPLLTGLTIVALYGTARNIWPEDKENALVATALLATSSQFLLMGMTAYAMPAHLALNTTWLWLYSQPNRKRFYLAPFIGVAAIGLHQPIVHALFAAPFLLRLPLQRRWRATAVFAIIYLAGCAGWAAWRAHYMAPSASSGGVGSIFRIANPRMAIIQPMNLLLIIGWSSLATPLLALLGFRRFFRLPSIVQDAAISCFLTFGFYYFFYLDQAHGWGYRYFHGTLSCMILVAVVGWRGLRESIGASTARKFLVAGFAVSIAIQLPLRCWQAESVVRPFARASAALHALPVEIVAFDPRGAWYSADLIRNDPFLAERPIIVSLLGLNQKSVEVLSKAGRAQFLERDTLAKFGLWTERFDDNRHDPFRLGRGK